MHMMTTLVSKTTLGFLFALVSMGSLSAAKIEKAFADLPYGPDEKQVMDVWLVPDAGDKPVPCVMNIHGGGWLQGEKTQLSINLGNLLKEGIAVVSIDYRYLKQTIVDTGSTVGTGPLQPRMEYEVMPPVSVPLNDIARALQFIRSHAAGWNIDPERIGVTGGSAGACSSLWLALHDDMADPKSADPIARQSTKPWCAAVRDAQTTLDPAQILELTPNNTYGGHAFGYVWDKSDKTVEIRSFYADRESPELKQWIAEYSPYALVTKDDPPIYLYYPGGEVMRGGEPKDPVHSANYGALLADKLTEVGVEYEFVHKGSGELRFKNIDDFFIQVLKR